MFITATEHLRIASAYDNYQFMDVGVGLETGILEELVKRNFRKRLQE